MHTVPRTLIDRCLKAEAHRGRNLGSVSENWANADAESKQDF